MISTVLPDHGVLFQLTSTFVGHKDVDTHVTHLVLDPLGEDPTIETEDHPPRATRPNVRSKRMRLRAHPHPRGAPAQARTRADHRHPRRRVRRAGARRELSAAHPPSLSLRASGS